MTELSESGAETCRIFFAHMPDEETECFLSETKFGQANLIPKTRPRLKMMPFVKCRQR